jgi:hypothetical protein
MYSCKAGYRPASRLSATVHGKVHKEHIDLLYFSVVPENDPLVFFNKDAV